MAAETMFAAIRRRDTAALVALLSGTELDAELFHDDAPGHEEGDGRSDTLLSYACELGHFRTALVLMARGADPRRVLASGRTPLHGAATSGNLPLVVELVARGADPLHKNDRKATPLSASRQFGKTLPVTEFLVGALDGDLRTSGAIAEVKALPRDPAVAALLDAVWRLDERAAFAAAERTSVSAAVDTLGRSPLTIAVMAQDLLLASWLLAQGCSPEHADGEGRTPRAIAAQARGDDALAAIFARV
jgi:ankyrin repeat protein